MTTNKIEKFIQDKLTTKGNGIFSDYIFAGVYTQGNKYFYIRNRETIIKYIKEGFVYILDEPIPYPYNNKFFHYLATDRPSEDYYVTHSQLLQRAKDGKLKVKTNGYWAEDDPDTVLGWFISALERGQKNMNRDLTKALNKATPDEIRCFENGELTYRSKPYEEMTDAEKSLARIHRQKVENVFSGALSKIKKSEFSDEITVYIPTGDTDRLPFYFGDNINEIMLGNKKTNNYEFYCQPSVSEIEIKESVTFANFFISDQFEEKNYFEDGGYDLLQTCVGRHKIQTALASNNVGYGQGGNSTIHLWENDDEFVVTKLNSDWGGEGYHDNYEYCVEKYGEDHEETLKYKKQVHDYEKFIDKYKPIKHPSIDMGVWRWMCAETSDLKQEDIERIGNSRVDIPYTGKLRIENHYHKRTNTPEFVFAYLKKN